jgi:hypothetical protein
MSTITDNSPAAKLSSGQPMLQINRLNYVKVTARILDGTDGRLKQYLQFASERMGTEITNNDVIEYALNMLFDRDSAFKSWLKRNA